ncbi:MAG TPA: type II toxin-antitoxin system HicA family toxin [Dehalococcoidia bacterium]|nr:type II toxin-antitoxin system HicA family toxin [Dehalococcoidia bacterium]
MPRRPRVTAREIIRALERAGFALSRTRGGHHIFKSPDGLRRVTVPYHGSRVIPPGTVDNILRQAGITTDEFAELLKR